MSYNIRFKSGKYEGTRLEIMPSKAATQLPDGTEIRVTDQNSTLRLNDTQKAHEGGLIDVHEPQVFEILNDRDKTVYRYEGPSIAQEWKLLMQGKRPYYRNMGRA